MNARAQVLGSDSWEVRYPMVDLLEGFNMRSPVVTLLSKLSLQAVLHHARTVQTARFRQGADVVCVYTSGFQTVLTKYTIIEYNVNN